MVDVDFIAIDFETATSSRVSICEAGICVVKGGKIIETKSWLVRPENNLYYYWNTKIHGITEKDTENAPDFPTVWKEIEKYLLDCPTLVAHNAAFDIGCIKRSLEYYKIDKPEITYYCSLRAARHIYNFECNKLDALCNIFEIHQGKHHRAGDDAEMCARLFLREIRDAGWRELSEMSYCKGCL
ncbi:MAG: 3'-5' exonuclease [Muribaculaceae bacterium]|nr:3'-5' exonuclease [Muribaculaceae bacterium]